MASAVPSLLWAPMLILAAGEKYPLGLAQSWYRAIFWLQMMAERQFFPSNGIPVPQVINAFSTLDGKRSGTDSITEASMLVKEWAILTLLLPQSLTGLGVQPTPWLLLGKEPYLLS